MQSFFNKKKNRRGLSPYCALLKTKQSLYMELILSNLHIADNMTGTTMMAGLINYDDKSSLYISSPFLVGPQTDKCASKQKTCPLIKIFSIDYDQSSIKRIKEQGSRVSQAGRLTC